MWSARAYSHGHCMKRYKTRGVRVLLSAFLLFGGVAFFGGVAAARAPNL